MQMLSSISIDLEDDTRRALDRLAQQTHRSVRDLVQQAVRDYLELQEWQRRKIMAGMDAAERDEFTSEHELDRIAAKYSKQR
jgi:RHH-type transcriptional regulator, rel operon repressor / antitoxin RelB